MDEFFGMHGPHGPHWFWGPGVFGLLLSLLFTLLWLAPLALLLWYARHAAFSRATHMRGAPPAPQVETPSAVEALRQQYVRGEIDFDTFERVLADLDAGDRAQPPAGETPAADADEEQAPPQRQFRPRPDIPVDWS